MASATRVPPINLGEILKAHIPTIDLRIKQHEPPRHKFLHMVAKFTNRTIAQITERRKAHLALKKRISEKIATLETQTNECKLAEIQLLADLEKEREEKKEAEIAVGVYTRKLNSLSEKCQNVDAEIERYAAMADNLDRERAKEREILEKRAAEVAIQVDALEDLLKCHVEGIGADRILFSFTHVDPELPKVEFSFVVDVSKPTFKVMVPSHAVPNFSLLVSELNKTQDLCAFVRNMRVAFVALSGHS